MKIPPFAAAIGREAVIVLGGALIAAVVVRQLPGLKSYIKNSWN